MPHILISHLGNRNLLWHGRTHSQWLGAKPALLASLPPNTPDIPRSFRAWTTWLLTHFDQEVAALEVQIFPLVLERETDIDRIVLLCSRQPADLRQDQDTDIEGELVRRLLQPRFPQVRIDLEMVEAPVFDQNVLMRYYRGLLHQWQERFDGARYTICDAGGTSQQKSALKLVFEYLFDRADYQVYYVAQGQANQSVLQTADPVEYRRILDAEQVASLIEVGEYRGAARVWGRLHREAETDPVYRLLNFGRYRLERLWQEADRYADYSQLQDQVPDLATDLDRFVRRRSCGQLRPWAADFLPPADWFALSEHLAIFEYYHQLGQHTEAVINAFRFIEAYLYRTLEHHFGYPFTTSYPQASKALQNNWRRRFPALAEQFRGKKLYGGVPLMILCARMAPDPSGMHGLILDDFTQLNSFLNANLYQKSRHLALDSLRHQIAHQGLGITPMEYAAIPDLSTMLRRWAAAMGMPVINPYLQLNLEITRRFRAA